MSRKQASPVVFEAAEKYIAAGYHIVAVRPNKQPWGDIDKGKNWRRPFSAAEISDRLKLCGCTAIGFLGGKLNHGIVPLDFDSLKGATWWRKRCEAAGIDPDDFPTVITPGKIKPDGSRTPGKHRYVHDVRGTLGNSEGKLTELGINVRGAGHVMLPPSPHPHGGTYYWDERRSLDDYPDGIPACPDFIYDAIKARTKAGGQGTHGNGQASLDDRTYRYCRKALDNERQRVAQAKPTTRNQTLNNAALALGHLAHYGAFSEDEVRAALQMASAANEYLNQDGVPAFEATFNSGWGAGTAQPRDIKLKEHPASAGSRRRTDKRTANDRGNGVDASEIDRDAREHLEAQPAETDATPPVDELGEWDAGRDITAPIPPRPWLLGTVFCLGYLSSLFGQGGVGKTAVRLLQYLSVALGRSLLGDHVFRQMPVLIICLEDDRDEIRRRLKAAMIRHNITPGDLEGRLFIACPRGVRLADLSDEGSPIRGPLYDWTRDAILRRKPGLVSFDPFMKTHGLPENDNKAMDFVAEMMAQMAIEFQVTTDAPHHTRKGIMVAGDADAGRGASAIKDDARLVYTLVRMTSDEAEILNISEAERRLLVRLDSAKVNLAPPSTEARWFKLIGVELGNGTEEYPAGDNVQTAEKWTAPQSFDGVNTYIANEILNEIDRGLADGTRYSSHHRAGEREARHVIQRHLPQKTDKQARKIIKTWEENGVLHQKEYEDPRTRKPRLGLYLNPANRPGTRHDA
jgi:hypothetical protein